MTFRIAFAGFNLESVTAVPQIVELAEFERVCVRGRLTPGAAPSRVRASGGC